MSATITSPARTSWLALFGIFLSHLIVFGILYIVLSTFVATFAFHYENESTLTTPQFDRILAASGYVMNYSVVAFLIVIDFAIIMMIAKSRPKWLSTYSHILHLLLALVLFLSFALMVHPLAWDDVRKANTNVAIDSSSAILTADSTKSP